MLHIKVKRFNFKNRWSVYCMYRPKFTFKIHGNLSRKRLTLGFFCRKSDFLISNNNQCAISFFIFLWLYSFLLQPSFFGTLSYTIVFQLRVSCDKICDSYVILCLTVLDLKDPNGNKSFTYWHSFCVAVWVGEYVSYTAFCVLLFHVCFVCLIMLWNLTM